MWTTAACIAWLGELGVGPGLAVDVPVLDLETAARKMPPKAAVITLLPGLGLTREGAFDRPAFQVSVQGEAKNRMFAELEDIALRIDRAVTFAQFPMVTSGLYVLRVQRSGGRPAAIGPQDPSRRTPFTATYIAEISTGPVAV